MSENKKPNEKPASTGSATPKPAKAKLDKAHVADTALDVLNDVGLEGLTLRAIAKQLNVQAPALYWHFKNKQALLDEMATVMFRRMIEADGVPAAFESAEGWREGLLQANRHLRAMLLRYRDGAKVFSGSRLTGTDHGPELEAHLRQLIDAGFTAEQAAWASNTASMYTLGFVSEEQGMRPEPTQAQASAQAQAQAQIQAQAQDDSLVDIAERAEKLADYPLAAAAGSQLFASYDERFEEGLQLIVAGISARYGVR
ncbi:TetR/AcrR family transcriptional regulator C-terminal domain-containing protein [Streptomyces sp. NPDC051684]|uniref:TetR/AcrR family transcriptional regulator C-terminal domain-containing protein n=1 Tax=Streptomyces sp. NPDC051684 TaxID=3365670 RepID=UPI0037B0C6FE